MMQNHRDAPTPLTTPQAASIKPQELKRRLDAGEPLVMLDVREPEEHAEWKIEGSLNVPLGDILAGASVAAPPGVPVVTICRSAARSERARQALSKRGIVAVNLAGGMIGWNGVYDTVAVPFEGAAEVLQFRRVGKGCLAYMVVSEGEAAVIDPTLDISVFEQAAADRNARITRILDTHAHADHVSGSRLLRARTGASYLAPDEVGPAVAHVTAAEGVPIPVGGVELRPLLTPGHTPQSTTYLLGDLAFTGDTLFVESVGRPDLGQDPRPNAKILHKTLREKIFALPDETRVLPGHYSPGVALKSGAPVTETLIKLLARLPALQRPEREFVEWVVANTLPKPSNFDTIKQINKGQIEAADLDELHELEAGPNRCAVSG